MIDFEVKTFIGPNNVGKNLANCLECKCRNFFFSNESLPLSFGHAIFFRWLNKFQGFHTAYNLKMGTDLQMFINIQLLNHFSHFLSIFVIFL